MEDYTKLTEGERLKLLLDFDEIKPYGFKDKMGYATPNSLYQILNGKRKIGPAFIKRFMLAEPKINIDWILTGKGNTSNFKIKHEFSPLIINYKRKVFSLSIEKRMF